TISNHPPRDPGYVGVDLHIGGEERQEETDLDRCSYKRNPRGLKVVRMTESKDRKIHAGEQCADVQEHADPTQLNAIDQKLIFSPHSQVIGDTSKVAAHRQAYPLRKGHHRVECQKPFYYVPGTGRV